MVLVNEQQESLLVLDADGYLRSALYTPQAEFQGYDFCHRPVVISDPQVPLGDVLGRLKKHDAQDF